MAKQKTIRVIQIASPIGRKGYQKKMFNWLRFK